MIDFDMGLSAGLLGTLILSVIFLYLYWLDREKFTRQWALGWGLYSLSFLEQAIFEINPFSILQIILHGLVLAGGLFWVWGTYTLVQARFPRRWFYIILAAFACVVTAVIFRVDPFFLDITVAAVVAGTLLCTGITILRRLEIKTIAARFCGITYILLGFQILVTAFLHLASDFYWVHVANVLLGTVIGVSFLMLYFQRTRFRLQQSNREMQSIIDVYQSAKAALQESEERFHLLIENTNEAIALLDRQGNIQFINSTMSAYHNGEPDDFIDKNITELFPPDITEQWMQSIQEICETGEGQVAEIFLPVGDEPRWFRHSIQPVRNAAGRIDSVITISVDIHERKKMEEALREREERYRMVVENAEEAIFVIQDNVLKFFNAQTSAISGYTIDELNKININAFIHAEDQKTFLPIMEQPIETWPPVRRYDIRIVDAHGDTRWLEVNPIPISWHRKPATLNFARDVTREREAQEALERERAHTKTLLDVSSAVMLGLDYQGRVTLINPRGCQVLKAAEEQILGKVWIDHFVPPENREKFRSGYQRLMLGELDVLTSRESNVLCADGSLRRIAWENLFLRDADGNITGMLSSGEDVTEKHLVEEALYESELHTSTLFEQAPIGIITLDRQGNVTDANARSMQILGSPGREASLQLNIMETSGLVNFDLQRRFSETIEFQERQEFETWYTSHWEKRVYLWIRLVPRYNAKEEVIGAVLMIDDMTERHLSEWSREAIILLSTELRSAATETEMYPVIVDQFMRIMNVDGVILGIRDPDNDEVRFVLGSGIWTGMTGERISAGKGLTHLVLSSRKPYLCQNNCKDCCEFPETKLPPVRQAAGLPMIVQDEIVGIIWVGREAEIGEYDLRVLTALAETSANALHRSSLHEATRLRSHRLAALRTIDTAITTSFDIVPIFDVLLEAVETQLNVDASAVWVYSSQPRRLEFKQGRGFKSYVLQRYSLELGQGLAGRVALEGQPLAVYDLSQCKEESIKALLSVEPFRTYQGVPLVAKGEIKGVLEVFNRSRFEPNREWLEFLNTLAGQAAIAIDNSELFNNLQLSNIELSLAYDETLEGWARALEMRDMETHGHSDRVTNLTLRLAVEMGVDDNELMHIRRGALLHDIGKMGIPDHILNKPGALNDEEWKIMHQHPLYAYRMLSPIRYLGQSLDIPYCHHEKWNGSGYPRGLKEKEIPLSARIFSVVDVWDALLSDRPYRPAWTKERTMDYIRAESGKHFDPEVVSVFIRLVDDYGNQGTASPEN